MGGHAAQLVDRALTGAGVVYGSPPPLGRDLDLCLRPDDHARVTAVLLGAGFAQQGRTWWRWHDGAVQAVDLRMPGDWGLPDHEVDDLFGLARPLEGYLRLVRPSPAHVLLLLARRVASGSGALDDRSRARLERALLDDPGAWEAAAARAQAWGCGGALRMLQGASRGDRATRRDLVAARAELRSAPWHGGERWLARALAWRSVLRRPRRGVLVAVCGLDGAGKSSQAAVLVASLEALGQPATVRWTRLASGRSLDAVSRPLKRVLRVLRRRPPRKVVGDVHPSRIASPEQALRQSSAWMTWVWAMYVATANGLAQRRSTRSDLLAGCSVVCDRWTLDSAVHLRYRYGEDRRFAAQVRVIRLLSPRPTLTVFLDIPAETAYERKDDHYDASQLRRQERLYHQEHVQHGAMRLDGTLPPEELSRLILHAALPALSGRRRSGRS